MVHWNGIGGAGLGDIPKLLDELEARWPSPELLIVHVGTNDLVHLDAFCFRQRIQVFMMECLSRFPRARLVWLDILPRACYFGAYSPSRVEMKRRSMNKWARSLSRRVGASVLHHPQFQWSQFHLFRYDGVHLSPEGKEFFRRNIRACIDG